jgi:hypothetical protein
MDDEAMTESDVIAQLGAERFHRLRSGGWLTPFYRLPGHEGCPRYIKHLVDLRHQEDLRLHPESRPPVVRKAYAPARRGGAPAIIIDRDGMRHVVTKAAPPAAGWSCRCGPNWRPSWRRRGGSWRARAYEGEVVIPVAGSGRKNGLAVTSLCAPLAEAT